MEFDELRNIPVVTIYKNGCIAFNLVFNEMFTPGDAFIKSKVFYFKDKNMIGFKFIEVVNKYPDFSYKPCLSASFLFSGSFIKHYKLDIKKINGKYLSQQIETEYGLLWAIDLNKKLKIIGGS